MNAFSFWNPTNIFYGKGQMEAHLTKLVKRNGKRILLVYGGGSIKKSGLYDNVIALLSEDKELEIFELPGVEPNPRLSTVHKGIEICRKENIDFMLAVGGGSVIDATKAISSGVKYDGDVWDFYVTRKRPTEALPFGTILTLAATGSEMNSGGVITNWETKEKMGAGSPLTFPKFSFCDPENTFSVPRDQTVYGIVDMMVHVMEEYFSHTPNTPLQERLCESVLSTVVEVAPKALANLADYEARETLMYCGTMALNGMISMGMSGDWATHGIEHEVSAIYDIPHGGGLAIIFPNWARYVLDAGTKRFYQMAVRVFHVDPAGKSEREVAQEGIDALRAFWDSIGAPKSLGDYGIDGENLDVMAEHAVKHGAIGGYKLLQKEDVATILQMCL